MGVSIVDIGTSHVRQGIGRERIRQVVEGMRMREIGREPRGAQGTDRDGGRRRRWHDVRHDSHGGVVRWRGEEEKGRYADHGGCIKERERDE